MEITLLVPKYAKNGDIMHSEGCKMAFGKKDQRCSRCIELMCGAPKRSWSPSFKQRDAQACREVQAHFDSHKHKSGGCGPVCTFGEW